MANIGPRCMAQWTVRPYGWFQGEATPDLTQWTVRPFGWFQD